MKQIILRVRVVLASFMLVFFSINAGATILTYTQNDASQVVYGQFSVDTTSGIYNMDELRWNFTPYGGPTNVQGYDFQNLSQFPRYFTGSFLASNIRYNNLTFEAIMGIPFPNPDDQTYISPPNVTELNFTAYIEYLQIFPDGSTRNNVEVPRNITFVQSPVPEPSTYAMMAVGLLGLLGYSRRRQLQV